MAGWIKLHRELMDHWVSDEPESLAVWIRLLSEANFSDAVRSINGCLVTVYRGQLVFGIHKFSARSGVSVGKLRRIIKQLQKDGSIIKQNFQKYSIISIVKYDDYQANDKQESSREQAGDKQRTTLEEGKNGRRGDNPPIVPSGDGTDGYPCDFEALWRAYPKRKGNSKKACHKAWAARIKQGARHEDIMAGVEAYARFCEHNGKLGTEYVKLAQTFLGPDEHYLADWSVGDCPHQQIAEIWNEVMPSHIAKVSVEDLIPSARGYADLDHAWNHLKTVPRRSSGKPVFETTERGLDFYRMVWGKLAASPRLQEESSSRWCKFTWAVKVDTTVAIAKDEYS